MRRSAAWLGLAVCVTCMAGCVERRFVITTSPPGAIVYDEKHMPTGAAPTDREFTFYGKYRFTLVKDGFQTMTVEEKVKAPWYEWLGLDFISENVIPWTIRDVRRFHYILKPVEVVPDESIIQKGQMIRDKAKDIGEPLPAQFPQVAPPPKTLPVPEPGPGPKAPLPNMAPPQGPALPMAPAPGNTAPLPPPGTILPPQSTAPNTPTPSPPPSAAPMPPLTLPPAGPPKTP